MALNRNLSPLQAMLLHHVITATTGRPPHPSEVSAGIFPTPMQQRAMRIQDDMRRAAARRRAHDAQTRKNLSIHRKPGLFG